MLKLENVLSDTGDQYIAKLAENQKSKGIRDTGYSAEHTQKRVTASGFGFTLELVGPAYWLFQDRGRGPNKSREPSRQMVQALKAWAVRHGMNEAAGYPIALKIAREGIRVPNPYNAGGVLSILEPVAITKELKQTLIPIVKRDVRTALFL